jgi:quinolinate synthase
MPEVMKLIKALHLEVMHPDFQMECTLELEVPLRHLTTFQEEIGNIEGVKLDSKGIY